MGKRITLYLTDDELVMIEKICAKDGEGPNMSRTLKAGLLKMFESCRFLGGPEHTPPHEPSFITEEAIVEQIAEKRITITKESEEDKKSEKQKEELKKE